MRRVLYGLWFFLIAHGVFGQTGWWEADQEYYHLPITEAGIYRLEADALSASGLPLAEIEAHEWELWVEGEAVPIYYVEDGGTFYLEFVASAPDGKLDAQLLSGGRAELLNPSYSMFSDTAHYYLSWAEDAEGLGQAVDAEEPSINVLRRLSYLRTDHAVFGDQWVKPYNKIGGANIYLSEFQVGEGFAAERARSFGETLGPVQPIGGQSGQLYLRFIGDFGNHQFSISLNGEEKWAAERGSFTLEQINLNLAPGELADSLSYRLEGQLDNRDRFYLAERKLIYPSRLAGNRPMLEGRMDTGQVVLDFAGGLSDPIVYHDITNQIRYVFTPQAESYLHASPGAHDFRYARESAVRTLPPPAKTDIDFSAIDSESNYIIITGKRLDGGAANPAIQAYAEYRSSEDGGDYQVELVNVEDLYFKYGYGKARHPLAIRNFARHLDTTLQRQPLVFIIGKGREYRYIRPPQALQSEAHRGFSVPTYGYPSSDNLMMAASGNSAPLFPLGRLAVESEAGILSYLDKVKQQEEQLGTPLAENAFWRKKMVHLVGGGELQPLITNYMENMGERLSGSSWNPELKTFERGSSSSTERPLTDEIYDEINAGSSWVTFFGHSATNSLGFDINIPSKYMNSPRHPFLLALGCYGGNINTAQSSVGEIYSSFEGGGFIGSIATSGPGEVTRLYLFARRFYDELGAQADERTLAQIFRAALQEREASDPRHVQQLMYFGDPALRIYEAKGPDYTFDASMTRISPQVINVGQDSFHVEVDILNLGRSTMEVLPLRIVRKGPLGNVLDEQTVELDAPGNRVQLRTIWPVGGEEGAGLNRLEFFIDPDAQLQEWPLPAARNNNELSIGSEAGFPFFVFNNGAELAWPYDYAIVPSDSLTLVAHSSNPLANQSNYLFQIDTVPAFTSPFMQAQTVSDRGGELQWTLPFNLQAEKVYYWRVALAGAGSVDTIWKSASFVYVPGREGWNQSHIGQWLQNDSLFLNAGPYRLELPKEALNITIQNRVKGGSQTPNFVANGINVGSVNRAWNLVDEGIGICVIDTIIYTLQPNEPGGLYGSVNDNSTTRAFVFRTDQPQSRADAVRFLDSIVPDNSHVFIFTIFDAERNGTALQIDSWAADTLIYGTSLMEALERRGATALENLMQEERQVYNFFYRQSQSGFTRLQEDFLFSTEDVLVNSETMGRRLPEGFFQSAAVELTSDTVTISVDYETQQLGDSVRVQGLQSNGDRLFETTSPDTLLWDASDVLSTFSFFVQLMNFETRLAPLFKHIRVYQPQVPDFFWSPNTLKDEPDTLFVKGTSFDWFSRVAVVGALRDTEEYSVGLRIQNQGEVVYQDTLSLDVDRIDESISLTLPTFDWPVGTFNLTAEINPGEAVAEKRYSNNILSFPFKLIEERIQPTLEVRFDDAVLAQGAWVRRQPRLNISVQKIDGMVPIFENELRYELRQPDGSLYPLSERISFSVKDTGQLIDAQWTADLDLQQEGTYNLYVSYVPEVGALSDKLEYRLEFQRENPENVRSLQLVPNPTSGPLFVHYDIIGSAGPSAWSLELIASDGRIVWQAEGAPFFPIGNHRLELGTIPLRISSGMYTYRFRLLDNEAVPYGGAKGQAEGQLLLLRP